MIEWEFIIELIKKFFRHVTQGDIAERLGWHSSLVTRIKKNGLNPTISIDLWYTNIFDPTEGFNSVPDKGYQEKSVAYLFKCLEEIISKSKKLSNIKENMSDCWFDFTTGTLSEEEALEKYKNFVMTMLKRARCDPETDSDESFQTPCENADTSVSGQNAASKSLISSPDESIQTSPETDSPSVITAAITGQKSVDPKHHTCYYCKNWYKVDKETDMQVKVKKCCKINKDTYYTGGHNCRDYDPHTIIIEISKKLPNPIGL